MIDLYSDTDWQGCSEIEVCAWGAGEGYYRPGGPHIEIEITDPWVGDTETGFGATTSINLSRKQAASLVAAIHGWLVSSIEKVEIDPD